MFSLSIELVVREVCCTIPVVAAWSVKTVTGSSNASTIHRIRRIIHTRQATSSSVGQYRDSAPKSVFERNMIG